MKRMKHLAATTLSLCLALPATAQVVDVDAGGTRVQVGGGAGVQVDTPSGTEVDLPAESQVNTPRQAPEGRGVQQNTMVRWLMIDQRMTQQLAQYGLTRSKNPDVRKLAETVVRDHGAIADRLQPFAGEQTGANPSPAVEQAEANAERRQAIRDQRQQTREAIRDQRELNGDARRAADGVIRPVERIADRVEDGIERVAEAGQATAEAAREAVDANLGDDRQRRRVGMRARAGGAAQLHSEIVARTARIARTDLEQREGYEFDAAFVGMLEAAHLQQQATLEVMASRSDGDLRSLLDNALETVKQHRQMAGQVMHNLKP